LRNLEGRPSSAWIGVRRGEAMQRSNRGVSQLGTFHKSHQRIGRAMVPEVFHLDGTAVSAHYIAKLLRIQFKVDGAPYGARLHEQRLGALV